MVSAAQTPTGYGIDAFKPLGFRADIGLTASELNCISTVSFHIKAKQTDPAV